MSSILLSIFCAKATSWSVGGLFLLKGVATVAGLDAEPKVNLIGVWAREPPELVGLGLGAPLELVLVPPKTPFVVGFVIPDVELGVFEGAGSSIWYWNWIGKGHFLSEYSDYYSI